VVDSALVATKIAAVRDATERVRAVLPGSADAFATPGGRYRAPTHQYGALDWRRVYALASSDLGDLDTVTGCRRPAS
jgi:hypothetical protein